MNPSPPFLLPSIPSLYENEDIINNSDFDSLPFQRNTNISIKFVEGSKLILIDMMINKKDQPKQILTNLFTEENLPPYLYLNSLSCLNLLCKEDRNESLSSLVYDQNLYSSGLKIWPSLLQRVSSINYNDDTERDDEKLFIEGYNFLLFHSKETRETLLSMEQSLHELMLRKNEERDSQIEHLHQIQSQEMDYQLQTQEMNKPSSFHSNSNPSSININSLVGKHLNEMNLLEQKFEKELSETMNQQRIQFRDFVKQFYEIEVNNPTKHTPLSPTSTKQREKKVSTSGIIKSTERKNSAPTVISINPKSNKTNHKISSNKIDKKKPIQPLPIIKLHPYRTYSSLNNKLLGQNKIDFGDNNTNNPTNNPINKKCIETLTIYVGAQLKSLYNIQLFVGSPLDFLFEKDMEKKKKSNIPLYSFTDGVGAIILLVDDQINYNLSNTNTSFLKIAKSKTELHFGSVETQIEVIKKQFSFFKPSIGDFFITNHSNLPNTHLVFHLVSHSSKVEKKTSKNKNNSESVDQPLISNSPSLSSSSSPQDLSLENLLQGLKNILNIATQYNVSTITVPLLLVDDSLSAKNFTEEEYSKRVSQVIKAVKSFLVSRSVSSDDDNNNLNNNLNSSENSLKTIRFILHENTSKENMKRCVSMIHSYFST